MPTETFWPLDLLPTACPKARILSFGYDSHFSAGLEQNPPGPPYLAHSLGGLVVANAVSRQHGVDETVKELSENTIGMIFLGTPFEGSARAEWDKVGSRLASMISSVRTDDIRELQKRSEKLGEIVITRKRPLEIVCYFEQYPMYIGTKDIGNIVTKPSAASLLGVTTLFVPANHNTMCKFSGDFVNGYISVSGQLMQWIKALDTGKKGEADNEVYSCYD
ncbi:hypothetical protein N7488_000160 [Penicillium malachiteum]|nr:hypothetical protein N7488_000160 [Penicillium malachiteum]